MMIFPLSYDVAQARRRQALDRAAAARLGRAARRGFEETRPGVRDALGHGLIALGTRLVSERPQPPPHRRAA